MASPPNYVLRGSFGFPPQVWKAAKMEIRTALIARARKGVDVSYSELAALVNAIPFNAHDQRFFAILGQISTEEHENGRPLLSVLVVHKEGDQRPGEGFFELAESLGRDITDKDKVWISELKKVYKHKYK